MIPLLIYIFHFWLLNTFFKCFFDYRKGLTPVQKSLIWVCFFLAQLFVISNIADGLILFICNCLITLFLSLTLYTASWKKKIFVSIASCSLGMLFEIITSFVIYFFKFSAGDSIVFGIVLSKLLMLSTVHGISIFKKQKNQYSPSLYSWIQLLVVTIASIIIIYTLYVLTSNSAAELAKNLSFVCMILLLVINICFFVFEDRLSKSTNMKIENLIMAQQIKRYETLRSGRDEQLHFFNREKHNLKNQLLSLRAYALNNNNTAIIDFINKILNESDYGLTPISVCDNLVIDAILSSKLTLAKNRNIHFTWDIDVPAQLAMNDIDLCILLGNAVENAFDACAAVPDQNKFIHITIKEKQNCLYFYFENSYFHNLHKTKNVFHSTKSVPSAHGYGLPSIQNIVDKYNGTMDIETSDKIFTLKAMLYLDQSLSAKE